MEVVAVGQSKDIQKPQLHVSDIVQSLNRFCWQKQAGGFTLPKQVDSKYCILLCVIMGAHAVESPVKEYVLSLPGFHRQESFIILLV